MGTVIEITEQRRVEERLRKNQEKYRALFNQSKEAIIITDTDGVIVEINQTGLALFGYRQEELVGQNITKLYLDKTTLPIQRCQHLPKNNGEKDQELLIRRKDGNACIGLFTVLALTDEEGQVYLYVVSFRDVTDKKAIENTLYFTAQLHRKDEAFFSEILQHLTTSLGISTAFIGEAHPEEKDPIRVIALYHQGE
jgi:PAS domain S-box-containing protein